MQTIQLLNRLESIAHAGLVTANQSNPFWSKKEAMTSINHVRKLNASYVVEQLFKKIV